MKAENARQRVQKNDPEHEYVPAPSQVRGGVEHTERMEHISRISRTCTGERTILDDLADQIAKYCVLPSEEALVAVTLWTVATHLLEHLEYAPRLVVRSGEKQSGKSRLVNDVLGELVFNPMRTTNISPAAIVHAGDSGVWPTLILDEADTVFGSRKVAENNEPLRGVINAGFEPNGEYLRYDVKNRCNERIPVFAFACLAGIGRMPDTIEDRAVIVQMVRRRRDQEVARFRRRDALPELHAMRARIEEWAGARSQEEVDIFKYPNDLVLSSDRAEDVWAPLVSIADAVSEDWGKWARESARFLTDAWKATEASDQGHELLQAIRNAIKDHNWGESFRSKDLTKALMDADEGMPWEGENLTSAKLGIWLKRYDIHPRQETTGKRLRFYLTRDFNDAFVYLGEDR